MARSSDQVSCRRRRKDYKDLLKSLENPVPCPGPESAQSQVVFGVRGRVLPPTGSPPTGPMAPVPKTCRICDTAPQVPPDEELDTTEAQPTDDVPRDDSHGIVEYINNLLLLISDINLRNKAELALSESDGIRRRRHQRSAIYKFLQRLHSRSPKSVAERFLDSDLSYEGLVAERSFSDEDFLRKWKPVFERDCFADLAEEHPGQPINDLMSPILVSDIVSALASMKESSPGPDGLHLNTLRDIPVQVNTLLCNLLLLKGPPPSKGRAGNIFTSRVTFIMKVDVPGDPLEFRPIAIGTTLCECTTES
ncbi:unnamed protein product [Acanthosepion pharaonis]|uniref:Uncharacterized protein n=1 Tax=Acanthosepion pharaonis TaxID=158019 RepID=A0A812B7B3_ACAPH|nr:unnamed protein product [Sepia pharaonis]